MYETECEDIGDLLPFNPRILMRTIKNQSSIIAACAKCSVEAMERISAQLIHTPAVISVVEVTEGKRVKRYKSHRAYTGADTWRTKGGMMGGSSGSCRGSTSNNGMGVVPQAFCKP
jgi:hypothetical protein